MYAGCIKVRVVCGLPVIHSTKIPKQSFEKSRVISPVPGFQLAEESLGVNGTQLQRYMCSSDQEEEQLSKFCMIEPFARKLSFLL
jgi:hypothetical protein